ncbi:MAG: hypothetical protein ACK480_12620 [Planctomycetota bacterium]|jgi:hypothetical protein
MVTSINPIIQHYTPRGHARVGDRSAYVTLEPDAHLDSTTSATQLAKQTHASPHVAITNGTDSYHRNRSLWFRPSPSTIQDWVYTLSMLTAAALGTAYLALGHVLGLSMVIDLLPSQRALDQQETP